NKRFVDSRREQSVDSRRDKPARETTAKGQKPIVSLLTCADSRIVPEFIFDQHLGSIFEVRNAGNVVEEVGLGSIEYGVEHLHTPVLLVMGHKNCGAVKAVNDAGGEPLPDHLKDIQARMSGLKTSIDPTKKDDTAFLVGLAEKNATQQAKQLLAKSE